MWEGVKVVLGATGGSCKGTEGLLWGGGKDML